mmetsp:Transcript_7804/g.14763  ORF Transcript_7804/g.14763 Transcript_7804/m.14763 type:complete len:196 (-) Transcript_7804:281-868(-)
MHAGRERRRSSVRFADEEEAEQLVRDLSEREESPVRVPALTFTDSGFAVDETSLRFHLGLLQAGRVYEAVMDLRAKPHSIVQPPESNMTATIANATDFPHLTEDTYGDEVPPHGTFLRVMLHTPHEGTIRTSIGICFETPSSGTVQEHKVVVTARIMSERQGTPQLRPYVRLVGRRTGNDESSEASDWQGFSELS